MKPPLILNPRFEPVLRGERLQANSPSNSHWGCMFAFTLPFLVIGIMLLSRLVQVASLQYQLRTNASSVPGKVNRTWVDTVDGSDFYYLRFRFTVDSHQYAPEIEISERLYQNLRVGDDIQILYNPENPEVSLPSTALNWNNLIFYGIVNLLWNSFTIFLCFLYLKDWWTERRCLEKGQLLETTITKLEERVGESGLVTLEAQIRFKSPETGKNLKSKIFVHRDEIPDSNFPEAPTPGRVLYCSDSEYIIL